MSGVNRATFIIRLHRPAVRHRKQNPKERTLPKSRIIRQETKNRIGLFRKANCETGDYETFNFLPMKT